MSNIILCPSCGKSFISEEYNCHTCKISVKNIVDIDYVNFFTTKIDGKDVAVALSKDGTLYRIHPKSDTRNRHHLKGTVYRYVHGRYVGICKQTIIGVSGAHESGAGAG